MNKLCGASMLAVFCRLPRVVSSLADHEYVRLINQAECRCLTMERDQYQQNPIVVIVTRPAQDVR